MKSKEEIEQRIKNLITYEDELKAQIKVTEDRLGELTLIGNLTETLMKRSVLQWVLNENE